MKTELLEDEVIIKSGAANMQRGMETVGGKMYLTGSRLIFEAHKLNVQSGATEIPLAEVREVTNCWTKFLNLIPIFPNGLAVTTMDGQEHRFVVYGRNKWGEAIADAQQQA